MLKKMLLTVFVLATFGIYSFQQRQAETPTLATTSTSPSTTSNSATTTPSPTVSSTYKDGQYTGTSEDAFYGFVKVKATITGGKLVTVEFLTYPNDHRDSVEINSQAMPILQSEAIKAQSSKVDIVSGATDTSQAFIKSLSSALNSALAT
jgi:uncharacterized protein with FMN-binding domain